MCILFCFLLLGVHSVTCMDACCVESKSEREREMLWTIAVLCAGRDKRSTHYIDCMYCELWVRCGAGDYNLKSPSSRRREHLFSHVTRVDGLRTDLGRAGRARAWCERGAGPLRRQSTRRRTLELSSEARILADECAVLGACGGAVHGSTAARRRTTWCARARCNHRRHCIYYFPRFSIIWARQFCVAATAIESRYNLREWLRRVPVFARRFTLCAASIWTAAAFPCRCGQIKTERLYCDLCVVPWHLAHTVVLCHLALLVSFGLSHDS
jgi:hypothetical protein